MMNIFPLEQLLSRNKFQVIQIPYYYYYFADQEKMLSALRMSRLILFHFVCAQFCTEIER